MHYKIRRNTQPSTLLSYFQKLRLNREMTDVTLSAEGRHYPCHRMVVAAASPYFEDIFKGNSSRKLVVVLVGVKAWEVAALLDYMYEGECRIRDQAQLEQFLGTADLLKIKGLQRARSRVRDDGSEANNASVHHMEKMEQVTNDEDDLDDHELSPPIQQKLGKSMQPESEAKASGNEDHFQDVDGNRKELTNYVSDESGEPSNSSRGCGKNKITKKSPKTRRSFMKYQRKIDGGNGQSGGSIGSSSGTPRARRFPKLTREERAARCRQAVELVQRDAVSVYKAAKLYELPNNTVVDYMKRHGIQK